MFWHKYYHRVKFICLWLFSGTKKYCTEGRVINIWIIKKKWILNGTLFFTEPDTEGWGFWSGIQKITALHFPLFAFQSVAVAVDVSQLSSLCRIVAYSRSQHSVQLTGFWTKGLSKWLASWLAHWQCKTERIAVKVSRERATVAAVKTFQVN